jgi:hypothetical protein
VCLILNVRGVCVWNSCGLMSTCEGTLLPRCRNSVLTTSNTFFPKSILETSWIRIATHEYALISRDRGDEHVRLSPVNHPGDFFNLLYLNEILAADEAINYGFEGFENLPRVVQRMHHVFNSSYYSCYRRAYVKYENCRNLSGIKMPDGADVLDYGPRD